MFSWIRGDQMANQRSRIPMCNQPGRWVILVVSEPPIGSILDSGLFHVQHNIRSVIFYFDFDFDFFSLVLWDRANSVGFK